MESIESILLEGLWQVSWEISWEVSWKVSWEVSWEVRGAETVSGLAQTTLQKKSPGRCMDLVCESEILSFDLY